MLNVEPTVLVELERASIASSRRPGALCLEGIDWRISKGDYWIVGGGEGAGKTDLLAAASGLQRPAQGTLRLSGQDIAFLGEAELLAARLRLGLVLNNGGRMFSHLTAAESVVLPLRYHQNLPFPKALEMSKDLLEATGLAEYAHVTPGLLSASWQQRLGLARALVLRPEVLFLDEPLAALESRHRRWWLDFLDQLAAGAPFMGGQPMTLVVATNDLTYWPTQGNRFALVRNQRFEVLRDRANLEKAQAQMDAQTAS